MLYFGQNGHMSMQPHSRGIETKPMPGILNEPFPLHPSVAEVAFRFDGLEAREAGFIQCVEGFLQIFPDTSERPRSVTGERCPDLDADKARPIYNQIAVVFTDNLLVLLSNDNWSSALVALMDFACSECSA